VILKLVRYVDHFSFAAANLLIGSFVSRYGGEQEFNDFILGVTFALFLYGFIKLIFISGLSVGRLKFTDSSMLGLKCYQCFLSFIGVLVGFCGSLNIFFYLIFFIITFLSIDYYRIYYASKLDMVRSSVPSVLYFIFVVTNYSISHFLGGDLLKTLMTCFMLVVFFTSLFKIFSTNSRPVFGIDVGSKFFLLYWLSNSAISHAPVFLFSVYEARMAATFFAMRSLFNAFSTLLRPKEVDFRLALQSMMNPRVLVLNFMKYAVVLYLVFALVMIFFSENIMNIVYTESFNLTWESIVAFSLYMILIWPPVLLESISVKQNQLRNLAIARMLDLVLMMVLFFVGCFFSSSFDIFALLLAFSSIASLLMLFRITSDNYSRGQDDLKN
jgi:hypothetical protein